MAGRATCAHQIGCDRSRGIEGNVRNPFTCKVLPARAVLAATLLA